MNKTITHFLLLSFLVFFNLLVYGQQQSVLPIEKSQAPGYAQLVCPNDQGQTEVTISIPEGYEIKSDYYFWNESLNDWTCFFCTLRPNSLTFQVPQNGKVFSVKVECSYDSDEDGIKEIHNLVWSFYGPIESFPNATPHPETSCNSQDGSITVTDLSLNPLAMPREYILYNAQGYEVARRSIQSNTYTFNNLASGNYTVRLSNGCTYNETTTTVNGSTLNAKIDGPDSLCLGTGTELIAIGGETYLWSTGATSSNITVHPSSPGVHTYSVQVKKGTCSQNAELNITVTAGPGAEILGPNKACYNGSITLTASGTGTYKWSTGATSSSISLSLLQSSQTYGLTITNPITKCSSADEHVVNVLPKPTLNDIPNSICAGASVHLSVNGGSSYSWNVGGTTASIVHSPSEFTEYRVTVTDANGCVYSLSKSVNVEALPRITFGGGTSICAGQSLNVTAFGGQSYRWDYNNATTATITVSPTQNTTYTVTATSTGGCTSSAQRVITIKPSPLGKIDDAPGSICPGQSVTLVASGGSTYRWTEDNATTAAITVSPTENTNYTVSITNTEGCTVVKSHSIAVNISGIASNDGPLTCSKTTVTLLGTSNAQGATFRWKNASGVEIANTPSTTVSTPGVYTLEISAAGGCTFPTATEVLLDRQVPIVSASNAGVITCTQPSINLLGTSSLSPASYEWSNASGTVIASTLNTSTSQAGTYTLKVTAANGCSGTASTTVTADLATPQASILHDGPLTCTKTSVTLNANPNNPNLQYTWRNSGGSIIASNSSSVVVTATGTYQLEARGNNGCTTTASATITQSGNFPNISVNNPESISCISPNATISGNSTTPGVTYAWYNPNGKLMTSQKSFSTNIAGIYTLKVTSAEGCVSSASTTLGETVFGAQAITLRVGSTYTNESFAQGELTCTQNSVSMSASARFAGYSISVYWTNAVGTVLSTTSQLTVSSPGYYYLKQNGCPLVKEILIKENRPVPVVQIAGEKLACVGKSTTLTASGGGQYNWSSGATTSTITTDFIYSPTTYTVTVSTGAYCSTVANVTVSNYPSMAINIAGETSLCAGTFVPLTASGGYTYKWSHNNATTESINVAPLVPTTYTVTATSDKGCTATKTHVISTVKSQPNDFVLNGLPTSAFCGEAPLNISVVSPISTYTWKWSTGETTTFLQRTLTSSQTVSVTATRNNGCTRTKAIPITVNTKPQGLIQGAEINCAGDSSILTAPAGEIYLWSTGASTQSIVVKPTSDQTYRVTVSNAGGTCSASFEKRVTVPAPLRLTHGLAGDDDCIPNNAAVIPIVSGGTGSIALGLIRSGELYASPNLDGLRSGAYVLRAEDTKGCLALDEVVIAEAPVFHLNLSISGDTLDCLRSNVQVNLSSTGARGSVSYHFDSPQSAILAPVSFSSSTLRRWVYAVDTMGCIDSVKVLVRDSIVSDLINDYTLAFDRDCIDGNAAITLQLSSAGATLPLSFQLNRETPTAQFHFDSLRAGYYLIRARHQDCRDSVAVLVDERIPRITGFQYLNQDDCKPNNTGVKLQAISGWGTLRYQLDTRASQDSSRFDSLAAGSHRFLVIDSLQCRDSLLIPISSEQPAYISVEDLVKCDSASGRISFRPNTQGVAAEYSIDGGKHWQTEVVFDSLPPGIYQPLRRKSSTGCIDSLNTVVLGRHCDTIPEAYFLQDIIRITEPNTSVLIRWEAKAPKWYRDTFYVKMKLEGDGFPHFNDGSLATARTPELRGGDPLDGPNVYRYIGGGTHRDSFYLPMQDSAHLYTYPADYYFTLSTPLGGKTLVDPDRDITRVTVSLLGPDVIEEEVEVTLCKDCTTIGKDDVLGVNCYYWPEFPNPGQKTQNVCSSGQFTRMALDENLVVIKKTVYTVKLSDLKVSIKEDFAVPRSCSPDDNFLEAVATSTAEGAITFKWSTGATTQRIKLRSDVSTYTVTVTQGDCTAEASYTQEVENDACELKKYFEDNGFFAIPISNLQKQPALNTPELRDDCPQPRGDANGKVKDFAGYTFEVNGGQVDPKSQLTQALNRFESVFGYSNGSGLITSNDEVCACPNYLKDKQAGFAAQGGLQFWYHVFKADPSCPETSCDMLFIKAKMPNGKTYPAGAADAAFLGAGYGVATQDIGLQGSTLLTALDDLCLDNFAAAKDPDMFELEPEEEEPEQVEELQAPCNQLGFHLEPVAVVAPTGQVMLAPKSSVWRFRRPGTEHFVDGALTGFTQVSITEGEESVAIRYDPDGIPINPCTPWFRIKLVRVKVGRRWIWGDRYEARTDPNQPTQLEGYFQVLGIQDKAFTFEVPPSPSAVKPLKIYTGQLDRAASTSQCGLKYTIYSNHLIYDPPKGFSTQPKGTLIKTMAAAGIGIPKAEYTYRICREDLVKLASSVNLNNKLGTLEVFMWKPSNSLKPGLYYKIEINGKKAYVFVAEDPGVGRRYYQFNCALGIWEEIVEPELSTVLPKLKHLDALWEVFLQRTKIHTALELASVVPFVGNLAGIANGVLYVNEGQAGQGTFEIIVGVIGLGLDIVEAGSLIRAGAAGGRGALVQSIWSVTCPGAPPFRSEVELRSVLGCNVEPVLGQVGAKAFNEAIGTAATTVGGDVLPKVEGLFNEFLKSSKGTAFLKWLHANQKLIPDVTKIITNAFGKLGFTVADFIKLSDDLIANPSLVDKLASSSRNLEWWLKLLRAGKNASRLSTKVYEQIAKLPDGILNDLLYYSDDRFKEFMDIADDALITELVTNPDLVKGLVSHKNDAYLTYFDDAVDYATGLLETPAGANLDKWLKYSEEMRVFLNRMAEARAFANNILDNLSATLGTPVVREVTFDVTTEAGTVVRTRLDGIMKINGEYVAIECKMGAAELSSNQRAFFEVLASGKGKITPVAGKASDIFKDDVGSDVLAKFARYWYKNEIPTPL